LAIVRRLVDLMNGEIDVSSQEGRGATFSVTLPFRKVEPAEGGEADLTENVLQNRKILVVDDNENNLKVMSGILDQWGCRHTEISSPKLALEEIITAHRKGDPYLCAIIDMMMPEWDGIQLARRVRQHPELADTLLMVMISSMDVQDQERELHSAGFMAVMLKPVNRSQLHDVLMQAMYNHGRTKPSVLIVDDDADTRFMTRRILKKEFDVLEATDTSEAEEILRSQPQIDVMFCDHDMPGETGLEFCKRLQEYKSPVVRVLMTGQTGHKFLVEAVNSQAMFRYLEKPATSEQMLEIAHAALLERRKRGEESMRLAMASSTTTPVPISPSPETKREVTDEDSGSFEAPAVPAHVLVAEDNRVNQKVAAQFLSRLGVTSDLVSNGKLAIEALEKGSYSAVLMDLHMPVMDGLEATREWRAQEEKENRSRLPIIALTADAIKGDREKCLEAGMDDYITKPLKLASLRETLSRFIQGIQEGT